MTHIISGSNGLVTFIGPHMLVIGQGTPLPAIHLADSPPTQISKGISANKICGDIASRINLWISAPQPFLSHEFLTVVSGPKLKGCIGNGINLQLLGNLKQSRYETDLTAAML